MDDKTQGKTDEVKGKARQAYGDLTDNDDQKAKGQAEETQGHAEKAVGDVKNAVNDLTGNS
jgi:uncharacterized protein YjbJ (UPF0337 family)